MDGNMEVTTNTVTEATAAMAPVTEAAVPAADNKDKPDTAQPDAALTSTKELEAKYEQEKAAAVQAALEEAAKKAAMKPDEVKEYEQQQREKELAEKERQLQLRGMKYDTREILSQKELPAEFADFLIGEDMEATKGNIEAFKQAFDSAVQKQVETRLKGTTPKMSSGIVGVDAAANTMAAEIDKYL